MSNKNEFDPMAFLNESESKQREVEALEISDKLHEEDEDDIKFALEHAEEMEEARKAFDEKGFSAEIYVTDEGEEEIGIFSATSETTPLQVLMEIVEADLPYLTEQQQEDYKRYIEEFGVEQRAYDVTKRRRELRKRFGDR